MGATIDWKRIIFLVILTGLFFPFSCFSQEFSYTHYDIADGLASATVYCMTQDKDGFIWVGTEAGVCRFDGTHFKNFTTNDGLPDIEVIQIFGDSKGRVWMAPFQRSVCFYYQGCIHNPDNDTVLRKVSLKGNIEGFAEDAAGNILIAERTGLHIVQADGKISNYDSIGLRPIRECTAISRSVSGHFLVQEGPGIWNLSGDKFSLSQSIGMPDFNPNYIALTPRWVVWREKKTQSSIGSLITKVIYHLPLDTMRYRHIGYSVPDDSTVCFCEFTGVNLLNLRDGSNRRFLPGIQVSRAFRDRDGSLWFTSLGHGLYRLNSQEIRTIVLPSENRQPAAVWSIFTAKNTLWAGTDHNKLFEVSMPACEIAKRSWVNPEAKNKIVYLDTVGNDLFAASSGSTIGRLTTQMHHLYNFPLQAKLACRKDRDEVLLGGYWGCVIYNIKKNAVTDTLWRERVTALGYYDGMIYIGTFNGLYRIDANRSITFLGKTIPFLSKRVTCVVVAPDHTLWAASADDPGMIGVRNDSVIATITQRQGLTSDICRVLLVRDSILWVGTDKGLNAIRLDQPGYPVTRYTSSDGLGSDMINTLFADSAMIY
ncbi:MAG TPA: two-component regulator propeller domain-containing protein, partial [Puia sp.]|nr:two-component regulator propeller domain-containing protein [Puia sp.]